MTFNEILQELNNGMKVRREIWFTSSYIFFNEDGDVIDDEWESFALNQEDFHANDWELYYEKVSFYNMINLVKQGHKLRNEDWIEDEYLEFDSEKFVYLKYKGNRLINCDYRFSDDDITAIWLVLEEDDVD